tara:strand:- start:423 stop:587 length:165 start_codon:yes stop_codon:yes gene_type:complete
MFNAIYKFIAQGRNVFILIKYPFIPFTNIIDKEQNYSKKILQKAPTSMLDMTTN